MDTFVMRLTEIHPSDAYFSESNWLVGLIFTVGAGTLDYASVNESGWFRAWCKVQELPEDKKEWWGGAYFFRACKFEVVEE